MRSVFIIFLCILLSACGSDDKTVGIIVPLEHAAMNEIVTGFRQQLNKTHPQVKIIVKNAQGDPMMQRAIIDQMLRQDLDLLIPIGTSTSQMTLAMSHSKPVIGLAALTIDMQGHPQFSSVLDELPISQQLNFIQTMLPKLSHMTIVHSCSDKILPEVTEFVDIAKEQQVSVQTIMIKESNEMLSLLNSIKDDSEAIYVLKDHSIVSQIPLLAKVAAQKNIPLISSDEGSVKGGASFALGVQESQIGSLGAELAADYFTTLVMPKSRRIDKPIIFYNSTTSNNQQHQQLAKIAMKFQLDIVNVKEMDS